jgi:hypothetical protein
MQERQNAAHRFCMESNKAMIHVEFLSIILLPSKKKMKLANTGQSHDGRTRHKYENDLYR